MKLKFRLLDVLMAVLGETQNLPSGYLQRAKEIENSLKKGKWKIVHV
jgi:hypothetical protein